MAFFGYRSGEVRLPKVNPVKRDCMISVHRSEIRRRMPVQVSLGPHLKGYAMPHPDLQDKDTAILGVCHRFGRAPPPALRGKIEKLREFVGKWIHENLTPLSPDTVIDFDEWLESTPYTMRRKEELRSKRLPEGQSAMSVPKTWKVKSFIKAETYPEYKHARGINSRSDEFKCAIGPWFKKIEKQVFQHSAFIKKIPVSDRPDYIMNLLQQKVALIWSQTIHLLKRCLSPN